MMLKNSLLIFFCFLSCNVFSVEPWTWCYKKKFLNFSLQDGNQAFLKTNTHQFTQLIFSWNALLPDQGSLQFWVRVHYADTSKWSDWHRMAEWNKQGGKTFYGKHNDGLEYCYVRLELPKGRQANGFHIKVKASLGAQLASLKALTVSISNMLIFESEPVQTYKNLPSIIIEGVPEWSQMRVDHPNALSICSPTSLCTLAEYVSAQKLHPFNFANGVFDQGLQIFGSWPCNIAYAYHATGGAIFYYVQRLHDFHALHKYLWSGMPVGVSVRCAFPLPGAPKPYPDGHFMTVIG